MNLHKEIRNLGFPEMVARATPSEDEKIIRISGYGAVFGKWYDVFGFKERIARGAFSKTLQEKPDIRGMFNHDPNFLLGRTASGTMTVSEDKQGLPYEILADSENPNSRSVARMIERGDVDGSSMAFFVRKEEWEEKDGRPTNRTITEIELLETGPVVMPASPTTSAKIARMAQLEGIDFGGIEALVVKHRAGFRLNPADDDLIARTIDYLERLKADPEAAIGTPTTPSEEVSKFVGAAWALRKRYVDALVQ